MKSLKKFEDYIVSYDRWGKTITVNYSGSSVYKTRLGALVSIVSYVLLISFTVNLFQAFIDGSRQTETAQTLKYETFESESYNFSDMSFGVQIILPPIPPRIATFTIYSLTKDQHTDIALVECVEESLSRADDYWLPRIGQDAWSAFSKNLYCLNDSEAFIQGNYETSSNYKVINGGLEPCDPK